MIDKETLRARWKATCADGGTPNRYTTASYHILRALTTKSNDPKRVACELLLRAFSPITNQTKLNNGMKPYGALVDALTFLVQYGVNLVPREGEEEDTDTPVHFRALATLLLIDVADWASNKTYLNIIVRDDLSNAQRAVQASHVAFVAGQSWPHRGPLYFRLYGVDGGSLDDVIELAYDILGDDGVRCFYDYAGGEIRSSPNRPPPMTAAALQPMKETVLRRKKIPTRLGLFVPLA